MNCPVCRNELKLLECVLSASSAKNVYNCEHCECEYEDRPDVAEAKRTWWKCTKLPIITTDSDAIYKLYEIESVCTGEITDEFPLGQFKFQRDRFANMDGEGYELVIAREDEFDEDGIPTFILDERVLCYPGDCSPNLHLDSAKNVKRWRDILKL